MGISTLAALVGLFAVVSMPAQVVMPARARRSAEVVTLVPSIPSPAPVGTIVSWDAAAPHPPEEVLWYRFRVRAPGEDFRVLRDYAPGSRLDWTADQDGVYEIEVSVRKLGTAREAAVASAGYEMISRVTGDVPVISPTANPLVYFYSAPPCPPGNRMRVQLQGLDGAIQYTPYKNCLAGRSMNFYLAGLRANARYEARHVMESGKGLAPGPTMSFATAELLPVTAPLRVSQTQPPGARGILLQSPLSQSPVATDLSGNVVWFYPQRITLTRPQPGGLFLGLLQDPLGDPSRQILREFDVAGTTLRETNGARINEQLATLGRRPITAFHHEVSGMPDGKLLVLANTEEILTGVQGPEAVDVLADMILVLDRDLQVVWTWDARDHLDAHRLATLEERCTPTGGGCPTFHLAPQANDWLHGNSLQLTPDGHILFSIRHQDWVIKIDYGNGGGSGGILWRLGKDGDFQVRSEDAHPWFSHQHDAQLIASEDGPRLFVFDNGNVRIDADPGGQSRGQVWRLDEANRVASPVLNASLGAYSFALGSAQPLPNGNYHFNLGILPDRTSRSLEVDPSGQVVYAIELPAPQYRTFRMTDLYTP